MIIHKEFIEEVDGIRNSNIFVFGIDKRFPWSPRVSFFENVGEGKCQTERKKIECEII